MIVTESFSFFKRCFRAEADELLSSVTLESLVLEFIDYGLMAQLVKRPAANKIASRRIDSSLDGYQVIVLDRLYIFNVSINSALNEYQAMCLRKIGKV